MQFKKGSNWKACYDEKRDLCTAGVWGFGCALYEISKETYAALEDGMDSTAAKRIGKGRKLYQEVNDRCGPPYTIVFDKNYQKLCSWADVTASGPEWPEAMVDAVSEGLPSQKKKS